LILSFFNEGRACASMEQNYSEKELKIFITNGKIS